MTALGGVRLVEYPEANFAGQVGPKVLQRFRQRLGYLEASSVSGCCRFLKVRNVGIGEVAVRPKISTNLKVRERAG